MTQFLPVLTFVLAVFLQMITPRPSAAQSTSTMTVPEASPGQDTTFILDDRVFEPGETIQVVRDDGTTVQWIDAPAGQSWVTFKTPPAVAGTIWMLYSIRVWRNGTIERSSLNQVMVYSNPSDRPRTRYYRQKEVVSTGYVRVELFGGDLRDNPSGQLTWQSHPADLVGKSLAITYESPDGVWCSGYLWLDGVIVAQGAWVKCKSSGGQPQTLKLTSEPAGFLPQTRQKQIEAGGTHAIVFKLLPWNPGVARYIEGRRERWQAIHAGSQTAESLRQLLSLTGEIYFAAVGAHEQAISALIPTLDNYDIVMPNAIVSHPDASRAFIDAVHYIGGSQADRSDGDLKKFLVQRGWTDSMLEGDVITGAFDVPTVSTVRVFEEARAQGIPLLTIQPYAPLPDLSAHSADDINLIQQKVQGGRTVVVPQSPLTLQSWRGTGVYEFDAATGYGGYWISGRLQGGNTTVDLTTRPPLNVQFIPTLDPVDLGSFDDLGGGIDLFSEEASGIFYITNLDDVTGVQIACGPLCGPIIAAGSVAAARAAPYAAQAVQYLASRGFFHEGFFSFNTFKRAVGVVGSAQQWHHIVRQAAANIANYGRAIHHPGNVIRIPDSIHHQINTFYRHPQPEFSGPTTESLNSWILKQSFEVQHQVGVQVLQKHSVVWP